jgi:tetratricopeptide (TPR) repeat protein
MTNEQSGSEEAFHSHLRLALEASKYPAARAHLDAALAMLEAVVPQNRQALEAVAWMHYADVAERFGDHATSADYNRRLLESDPEDLSSQVGLMRASNKLGNRQDAEEALRRSGEIAERVNDTLTIAMLATVGHLPVDEPARTQRIEKALHDYRQMLEIESPPASSRRYATIQYGLGKLHGYRAESLAGAERVRELREALEAFRLALLVFTAERFPDDNRALVRWLEYYESQLAEAT